MTESKSKHIRKAISKKTRFEVFKRDGFQCQYCGNTPPSVVLEVDHITPVAGGGKNDDHNLITACFDCNRGKGAIDLSVAPDTLAEKAAIIEEKQEQLKAFERLIKSQRRKEEKAIDSVEEVFQEYFPEYTFNPKFRQSVRIFVQKIPIHKITDAMYLACSRIGRRQDSIKYFCGICWKIIKEQSHGQG